MAADVAEPVQLACNVSLQTEFEYSSYPYYVANTNAHCVVSIRAEDCELHRMPIDLCALVDRSGSMKGSKLDLVKQAVKFMVQQLSSSDRLSVVSFDAQVQDIYGDSNNMNFMTSGNKKVAMACVDRIQAGGGTNLSAGLFRAIDHHQQQPSASETGSNVSNRIKSVFLFSDGISSFGITNRSQLMTIVSAMLRSSSSLKIHTLGFGNVYDEQTMNGLSEEGGGHSMCIQDAEAIPAAFATALGGLMSIVSQNVELTMTAQEGVKIDKVSTSFKQSPQADGSMTVSIGDLYAGEQKDLLVKFQLVETLRPSLSFPVLALQIRYLDISNTCMQTAQLAVKIARSSTSTASQSRNVLVLQHMQRCETSSALQAASDMADRGDLSGARQLLAATEAGVRRHAVNASSMSYAEDLRTTLNAFTSQNSYQSVGRNMSHSIGQEHSRQQTLYVDSGREPMYQSSTGRILSTMMYDDEDQSGSDDKSGLESSEDSDSSSDDDNEEGGPDREHAHKRGDAILQSRHGAGTNPSAAHSNHHSSTSTLDYQQQVAVSSAGKRKHGQVDIQHPSKSARRNNEAVGYDTHANVHN